jgi:hypothetical protein
MPSRVVTKVIRAAVVALAVELTDLAMDKTLLSADKFRLVRKILKAGVGAACGALLAKVLHDASEEAAGEAATDEAAIDEAAARQSAPAAEHA